MTVPEDALALATPDSAARRQASAAMDRSMQRSMPSKEDAEDFSAKVDEVSRLVDGLAKGTLTPEYIDAKMEREKVKTTSKPAKEPQPAPDPNSPEELERKAKVMAKVDEIKASMARKKAARERYEAYVQENGHTAGTDYDKWGLWCPEDEEDDLVASCTPQSAQLKAMEKDIDGRHQRMVSDRQRAERCRVAGNAAFAQQQWTEAYRCYEEGIDAERSNAKLQANAAMASIKMGCFAQAIEHCDKLIRLQEFLLEKPEDPIVVKALQRRAAARSALGHHKQAVADLEQALLTDPESVEVMRQHARAQQELAEQERLQKLNAGPMGATGGAAHEQLRVCKDIEACSRTLAEARLPAPASSTDSAAAPAGMQPLRARRTKQRDEPAAAVVAAAEAIRTHMVASDDMRAYVRACGGLTATMQQLQAAMRQSEPDEGVLMACCELLTEACQIDTNARHVAGCAAGKAAPTGGSAPALLPSLCALAHRHRCVAALLHTLAVEADARGAVASAWASNGAALRATVTSLPALHGAHRATLLALLANCASAKALQAALAEAFSAPGGETALLQLLQSDVDAASLQRVASLMTNAAASVAVRKQLAASQQASPTLVARAQQMLVLGTAAAADAALSCLQCLHNLALEGSVREQLADAEWLAVLQKLLPAPDAAAEPSESALVALATAARAASCPATYAALQQGGVVQRMLAMAAHAREALQAAGGPGQQHLRVLDAVVRALAAWGGQGHMEELRSAALLDTLVWACSAACIADSCAGNAALCVGYVADERSIVELQRLEAVKALVDCAKQRKGSPASRNAGIAAAKLAKDAACLEQLRECNGLEVFYSYVKP